MSASVHQRLLNKARNLGKPFNELLQYFVIERFLYRLSSSEHAGNFILKGGLMFAIWQEPFLRPTRDIDMLGYGDPALTALQTAIKEICDLDVAQDGLIFDVESITATPIRAEDVYDGVRIQFSAYLGKARISIQLDVGFGDIVIPSPVNVRFPSILNLPEPNLRGYSRESLMAEKFHAMVMRGSINSRMKDFYDIWMLSQVFDFEFSMITEAFLKTFERRSTELPLDTTFLHSLLTERSGSSIQWQAFLRRNQMRDVPTEFKIILEKIETFLEPVIESIHQPVTQNGEWKALGPWVFH